MRPSHAVSNHRSRGPTPSKGPSGVYIDAIDEAVSVALRSPIEVKTLARYKAYLLISRWTTRVANPFFPNARFIHSAIITDRCFPPVHPNAMVR